ncbi:17045_t:CDS:1, partial [Acaulospora morrowiae]
MTSTQNIDQVSMPTWQDIEKTIKEIVTMAIFYNKPKNGKFIQSYKKQYATLKSTEEPEEYIVACAITKFPNKEKYIEMKEQYRQWYRYESRLLKAIENLNTMYYKLAKPHFKSLKNIQSEIDSLLNNNDIEEE